MATPSNRNPAAAGAAKGENTPTPAPAKSTAPATNLGAFKVEPTSLSCFNHEAILEQVYGRKASSYKKSKEVPRKPKAAKKQITLKMAFANSKEKNFQGYDLERCTAVDGVGGPRFVFIPKTYGKATRKKFRGRKLPAAFFSCCGHCNLLPCSMLEYADELSRVLHDKQHSAPGLDETELLDCVRTHFRVLVANDFGKKHLNKFMPSNSTIPQCAMDGTASLVQQLSNVKRAAAP
jgi:hypothetical protein